MNCDRFLNVQAMLDRFSPFWAAGRVKISGGAAKATPHPGSHSPRPIISKIAIWDADRTRTRLFLEMFHRIN
jgi:hypothetical protein